MVVALYVIKTGQSPVAAIVMAQAVTVIAAPLLAGAMLWLTNRKDIMGEDRNSPFMNLVAGLGFVMLLAMAWYTATAKVWPKVRDWLG
jgi:Mn2+/Fe2+ NRAMP family transporter